MKKVILYVLGEEKPEVFNLETMTPQEHLNLLYAIRNEAESIEKIEIE